MPSQATAPTRLTEQQKQQFDRDGYLFPLPVLSQTETAEFLAAYTDYTNTHADRLAKMLPREKYQVLSETHFAYPWAHRIATHPRVLDFVEGILGPNILAWNSNWFTKMPGDRTFVSWHQDGMYWKLTPPQVVTAWIALTPSKAANGGMRVMPGTHKGPALPHRETPSADNALSRGQDIAVEVDETRAVELNLDPGEMSLHDVWVVHGSNRNPTNIPRIGIAVRYVSPAVMQESPTKPMAMLVRGRDDQHHFELLPPPTRDDPERHRLLVTRIRSSILDGAAK